MNLKEAAREIGVHYQTAYKWVRSGELAAVRIGNRYEVTDAAVERFIASRRTVVLQADVAPREQRRLTDVDPEDFLEELEAMATDPIVAIPAIEGFVARRGVQVLGDSCMVAIQGADGAPRHVMVDHPRADAAAFYNAVIGVSGAPFVSGGELFGTNLKQGEPVLMPFVDQALLRRAVQPELAQYLQDYPVRSLVGAPIFADGALRGMLLFTRDAPSAPYTFDDERYVERIAERVGPLVQTADEIHEAWNLRSELMDIVTAALLSRRPGLPFTGAELQDLLYGPGRPGAISELPSMALSPDDRILAVNPAAERLLSFTPRELQGRRRDETVVPPESFDGETEAHARLRSGEIDFHDSHAVRRRADGSGIDLAVHRGAVREVDSNLACIIGVARRLHVDAAYADPAIAMSAVQRA